MLALHTSFPRGIVRPYFTSFYLLFVHEAKFLVASNIQCILYNVVDYPELYRHFNRLSIQHDISESCLDSDLTRQHSILNVNRIYIRSKQSILNSQDLNSNTLCCGDLFCTDDYTATLSVVYMYVNDVFVLGYVV